MDVIKLRYINDKLQSIEPVEFNDMGIRTINDLDILGYSIYERSITTIIHVNRYDTKNFRDLYTSEYNDLENYLKQENRNKIIKNVLKK